MNIFQSIQDFKDMSNNTHEMLPSNQHIDDLHLRQGSITQEKAIIEDPSCECESLSLESTPKFDTS